MKPTHRPRDHSRRKEERACSVASLFVIGKDGESSKTLRTTMLEKVELQPGETLSWVEVFSVFDSSSWGFRDHVIRYGDAVARIHIRSAQNGCGHEVYVQIEGSPKDVGILAEAVIKMMGGKVVTLYPVRSWFARVADWWRNQIRIVNNSIGHNVGDS